MTTDDMATTAAPMAPPSGRRTGNRSGHLGRMLSMEFADHVLHTTPQCAIRLAR